MTIVWNVTQCSLVDKYRHSNLNTQQALIEIYNCIVLTQPLRPNTKIIETIYKSDQPTNCPTIHIQHKEYKEHHTINPSETKRRPLYLKTQSAPHCKHFSLTL